MSDNDKNLLPKLYKIHDPDALVELWKSLVSVFADSLREDLYIFEQVVDPDTTPVQYLDLMLASLGTPFSSVYLSDVQKRKLAKLLVPMYKQKGVGAGIINGVRLLTGLEVTIIDPYANEDDGWQVALSELGLTTYAGGRRVYTNMMDYSEDFDNAVWIKTDASVIPAAIAGPTPWGRDADQLDLSLPNSSISQSATPYRIINETFTASVWLKADSSLNVDFTVRSVDDPSDETTTSLSVTTEWQRFDVSHYFSPLATGDVEFVIGSVAGLGSNLYGWGAQLVRDDTEHPYIHTTNDGEDTDRPGAWAWHFFVDYDGVLTAEQTRIINLVSNFLKPLHTHYSIISD